VAQEEGRGGVGWVGGGGGARAALLVTAQQLHPQRDALVPLPRQDADVAAVERRLQEVLLVDVVVDVAREDLQGEQRRRGSEARRSNRWLHAIFGQLVYFYDFVYILCFVIFFFLD